MGDESLQELKLVVVHLRHPNVHLTSNALPPKLAVVDHALTFAALTHAVSTHYAKEEIMFPGVPVHQDISETLESNAIQNLVNLQFGSVIVILNVV